MLLFFDGIALALPSRAADWYINDDPYLAQPLIEQGLMRNFEPELWMTELPAENLSDVQAMSEITQWDITSSSTGIIPPNLEDISGEAGFVQSLRPFLDRYPAIIEQVLSGAHEPYLVRPFVVGVTSKLLSQNIKDVAVQPIIDDWNAAWFVASVIGSPVGESHPDVIVGDIARVGIDLTAVPLDEVVDFRRTHGSEYRAYSKEVRDFVLSLSLMAENDRIAAITERRADLIDRAEQLREIGRRSFKRQSISVGIGFAGAAWTLAHADPWGAAFAAAATAAGISRPSLGSIGAAYTYVFQAAKELGRSGPIPGSAGSRSRRRRFPWRR